MVLQPVVSIQAKSSLLQKAIRSFEENNIDQAREFVDQAVTETPSAGKVWYYQGVIYEKLLRKQIATEKAPELLEKTLRAYRKALTLTKSPSQYQSFTQINLNNLWAYYLDRGRRYYHQGNFVRAIDYWQCCEQIQSNRPCLVLYKAIAAHQGRQHLLAKEYYTSYLSQAERVPVAVSRAVAQLSVTQEKNPEEGVAVIAAALLNDPFDYDLLWDQLAFYKQQTTLEVFGKYLEQKAADEPQNAAYCYQLGCWYEYQGELSKALQHYQKAAQLAPQEIAPIRQQGLVVYNQAAQLTREIQEMSDEVFQEKGAQLKEVLDDRLERALSHLERAAQQTCDTTVLKALKSLYSYLGKPARASQIEHQLNKCQ